jgi:hypothetical protein
MADTKSPETGHQNRRGKAISKERCIPRMHPTPDQLAACGKIGMEARRACGNAFEFPCETFPCETQQCIQPLTTQWCMSRMYHEACTLMHMYYCTQAQTQPQQTPGLQPPTTWGPQRTKHVSAMTLHYTAGSVNMQTKQHPHVQCMHVRLLPTPLLPSLQVARI